MTVSDEDVLTLLARMALFEGVPADELAAIAVELDEQRHAAGEQVVTEGGGGPDFFLVVEGSGDIEAGGACVATPRPWRLLR